MTAMLRMPSTEIQRIVLLIALGIVGYLLLQAWMADYGQPPARPDADAAADAAFPDGAFEERPAAGSGDLPDAQLADSARTAQADADTAADAPQLVHVRTPTLEFWIDQQGGDIVRLELPGYAEQIDGEAAVRLLDQRPGHVYIAQSGLIGRDGIDRPGDRPVYEAEQSAYRIDAGTAAIVLRTTMEHGDAESGPGPVRIEKRFIVDAGQHLVTVEYAIDNASPHDYRAQFFAQLKRDASRPQGSEGFGMGPRPYVGTAFTTPESRYEKVDFEDLEESPFATSVQGGWAAVLQHYFLSAWVGDAEQTNSYSGRRLPDGNYAVGYVAPETVVAPGTQSIIRARFYAGPKIQDTLDAIAPNLSLTVDYGMLWWLSVPLFYILDAMHGFTGNWGVAIILLTVAVKLLLYPLASAGFRSMARMKKVMPQVKRLKERHAGDKQKFSQEMMALYRKEGANPFGGCLPLLAQMPVFLALYWVLFESVELRHAPFWLWIEDLSAPDQFFVLPILYAATFFLTQMLNPPPPDPMQARMMKAMPILFGVLFVFFPAGLVLYWLVNNVLSLAQQWHITRRIEKADAR